MENPICSGRTLTRYSRQCQLSHSCATSPSHWRVMCLATSCLPVTVICMYNLSFLITLLIPHANAAGSHVAEGYTSGLLV